MRIEKTWTGRTLFLTDKLWIHLFYWNQKRWVWGFINGAIHTPLFMIAYRPNILSKKK